MHPVSIRGRSMPRDHRTVRAIFLLMGLLCWSVSTGCLRSTMLRPVDGPVAQPPVANGPASTVLAPSAAPAGKPAAGSTAMATSGTSAGATPSGSDRADAAYGSVTRRNPTGHRAGQRTAGHEPHPPHGRRDRACGERDTTTARVARFRRVPLRFRRSCHDSGCAWFPSERSHGPSATDADTASYG